MRVRRGKTWVGLGRFGQTRTTGKRRKLEDRLMRKAIVSLIMETERVPLKDAVRIFECSTIPQAMQKYPDQVHHEMPAYLAKLAIKQYRVQRMPAST